MALRERCSRQRPRLRIVILLKACEILGGTHRISGTVLARLSAHLACGKFKLVKMVVLLVESLVNLPKEGPPLQRRVALITLLDIISGFSLVLLSRPAPFLLSPKLSSMATEFAHVRSPFRFSMVIALDIC